MKDDDTKCRLLPAHRIMNPNPDSGIKEECFFYISLLGSKIEDGRPASFRHDHDSKPRRRGVRSSTRQGHFVFGPQLRALTESVLGMCSMYVHTVQTSHPGHLLECMRT